MSQPKRHRAESDSEEGQAKDAGATNSTPQRKTIDEGVTSSQPPELEALPRVYPLVQLKMVARRRKAELHRFLYKIDRRADLLEIHDSDLDDLISALCLLRASKKEDNVYLREAYLLMKQKLQCRCPVNAAPPCCGKCMPNCACWLEDENFEDCKECKEHATDCNHAICSANYTYQ